MKIEPETTPPSVRQNLIFSVLLFKWRFWRKSARKKWHNFTDVIRGCFFTFLYLFEVLPLGGYHQQHDRSECYTVYFWKQSKFVVPSMRPKHFTHFHPIQLRDEEIPKNNQWIYRKVTMSNRSNQKYAWSIVAGHWRQMYQPVSCWLFYFHLTRRMHSSFDVGWDHTVKPFLGDIVHWFWFDNSLLIWMHA